MDAVAAREMMDVSLSALRLGAQEVHLVCLETRAEMPRLLKKSKKPKKKASLFIPASAQADHRRERPCRGS